MISLVEFLKTYNGTLKRFGEFALKIESSCTDKDLAVSVVEAEFGKNLINHVEKEDAGKLEISFFRKDTILVQAKKIVGGHGLEVEIIDGIFSVGVGGDVRSYTPVVNISGPFPGWEVLEKLSSEITNTLPINRVTFEPK